ncbi:MAG: type II secretion system minor pseudopilin GspI [Desulfuromonadales bacterium]
MSGRDRGFTLLEVMIALAIIAISLVTLLGLSNRSIAVNLRLQMITQATLLAQQRIAEIELQASAPGFAFSTEEGEFAEPFENYTWEVAYQDSPLPYLQIVTVTVVWGDKAKNEAVDLSSFVFRRT